MYKYFVFIIIIFIFIIYPKYTKPYIIKNFISCSECDRIIDLSKNSMNPSELAGKNSFDTNVRSSDTSFVSKDNVMEIYEKVSKETGYSINNAEDLQVVRYKPGGFYKPHHDACCFGSCSDDNSRGKAMKDKAPRRKTVIICLRDDFEGGETIFPNLNMKYKIKKGDALIFNTHNWFGMCTPLALHGGDTVISGEKWICNIWLH